MIPARCLINPLAPRGAANSSLKLGFQCGKRLRARQERTGTVVDFSVTALNLCCPRFLDRRIGIKTGDSLRISRARSDTGNCNASASNVSTVDMATSARVFEMAPRPNFFGGWQRNLLVERDNL